MNRIIALIPAREKSLRIKNKNLKKLYNKPLIWWTLDAAKKSKFINKIYVSSDSKKIINYSKKNKVNVIKRPKKFSNAFASKKDVIFHALEFIKKKKELFDYLIYLQPTSPLRTNIHIDDAFTKMIKKNLLGLVSVKNNYDQSLWSLKIKNDKILNDIANDKNFKKRSQNLKKIYTPNGAIYIFNLNKLKYKNQFDISKGFGVYQMDKKSSIDIDEDFEFQFADLILRRKLANKI